MSCELHNILLWNIQIYLLDYTVQISTGTVGGIILFGLAAFMIFYRYIGSEIR